MKKKMKQKYIPSKNSRENIRVKIEDLNEKGEGIAFHNKLKINVKKALPGEDVLVRYMPDRPRKDRIRLLEILSPSALRTQPPCQYFEQCGGCQLQHVRYKKQLEFKQNWLKQLLLSYPQLKQTAVDQVMGMPQPASYRNKTQMPFQKRDEKIIYGLYQKGTHEVTPIDYCLVENKDANRALQIIREWAEHYRI
ncbi:MAG: hypothetical protein P8184_19835, partial [Calditrichia bacterium]